RVGERVHHADQQLALAQLAEVISAACRVGARRLNLQDNVCLVKNGITGHQLGTGILVFSVRVTGSNARSLLDQDAQIRLFLQYRDVCWRQRDARFARADLFRNTDNHLRYPHFWFAGWAPRTGICRAATDIERPVQQNRPFSRVLTLLRRRVVGKQETLLLPITGQILAFWYDKKVIFYPVWPGPAHG